MALDALAYQRPQLPCGNGVKLDRRRAAEFLRPAVGLLGRTGREIPPLDLLAGDRWPLKMGLGGGSVAPKLGLNVAGGINAGRVVIAEVVDMSRLPLRLDCL